MTQRAVILPTSYSVILAVSGTHLINDLIQFLLPALYPLLKSQYALSYFQLGLLTLAPTNHRLYFAACSGALWRPAAKAVLACPVSHHRCTRRHSTGDSGIIRGAFGGLYRSGSRLCAIPPRGIACVPDGLRRPPRVCPVQLSGGRKYRHGPWPLGRGLNRLAPWPVQHDLVRPARGVWHYHPSVGSHGGSPIINASCRPPVAPPQPGPVLPRKRLIIAFAVIGALLLSKFVYIETFKAYYVFFLIEKFGLDIPHAQGLLFVFLAAVAFGTFFGGPIGDRIGRKKVIWGSIVGALPFAVLLPHAPLWVAVCLSIIVGLVLSSAFSAIVVYAQELMPQKVGMVAGFVFGFAFGVGALGAAALGALADQIGMQQVFGSLSMLLCLGFLTVFLPDIE